MKYKATEKFKELDRSSSHQGLTIADYNALLYGRTVENVTQRLIDEKYVIKVTKKGAENAK